MDFQLYGAAADYFLCEDREVLCESGARTGKTHSELVKAKFCAETYPGSRQLFARDTRASLTDTVLSDWEDKVLGVGHPAIGNASRGHRQAYRFPNGSEVRLMGLDKPDRALSMELDRFFVFQAEEMVDPSGWDALLSRLSGSRTPYNQATADANPSHERHWLIQRVREVLCLRCGFVQEDRAAAICENCSSTRIGRMRHLQYRHQDNPLLFDHAAGIWTPRGEEYLSNILGRLRGVRRKRLLEHQWVSEEGQILEDYDESVHRISGQLLQEAGGWNLHITSPGWSQDAEDIMRRTPVKLEWFGAGADWGFWPHPGVLQVWGYDQYARRFRVAEVYRTGQQVEWWAERAHELHSEFRLRYIAADPSASAMISGFNKRLTSTGSPVLAVGADNTIQRQSPDLMGIDLMRWGLRDSKGVVRTFFLRDALRYGHDKDLKEAGRPICTEDEITGWTWLRRKGTGRVEEIPDPSNDDHGCDAWRYEAGEGWGRRMAPQMATGKDAPGTIGAVLRHGEKMARAKQWRLEHGG